VRRAAYELGIDALTDIKVVLPNYMYTTPPYNGIIENEFCPVYVAYTEKDCAPNPDEVEAYRWLPWPDYVKLLQTQPDQMSYWAKDQYLQLQDKAPFASL
jgi:isopentenyl-diphosphate Delta-isomerase